MHGSDKWKVKYTKNTKTLELAKQNKKINVTPRNKVEAFNRMCETVEKLARPISWKLIEYLKLKSSEIEELSKSIHINDCNKENIGYSLRFLRLVN